MSARPFIVAIDGPAGAGKSTVSRLLARRLDFSLVDTGAIYRCVALVASREGAAFDDDARLQELLGRLQVSFKMEGDENRVFLGTEDVSALIRTPAISMAASKVSERPVVRHGLLALQRRLALGAARGAILEGRDIGTVVFPDAEAKFFLDAQADVRARRRYEELFQKGVDSTLEDVLADQDRRDKQDSTREIAPLKAAEDAVLIDSSSLPLSEVVRTIEKLVRERIKSRGSDGSGNEHAAHRR
ncbi:MAG TPA: (d)CMP kinase [Myxococcaceae bacterium]|nr:(d)CMP kinase [Myxococcaceae bacterium]